MARPTNIIKKTLLGISKAQTDYERWTGDYWLVDAPEYLTTTYIAKEIATIAGHFVTLEQDAKESIEVAGGPGKGKLSEGARHKLEGGRFDIVVWNKDDAPIVIMEVKKQPGSYKSSTIKSDVENICGTVMGDNSLQYGLIAYCSARKEAGGKSAEERTLERVNSIKSEAEAHINNKGLKLLQHRSPPKTKVVDGDEWAWIGVVLKISKA